jgi:hypothetical protein
MYRNEVSERNFSFLWKIKFIKNPRNYEKWTENSINVNPHFSFILSPLPNERKPYPPN